MSRRQRYHVHLAINKVSLDGRVLDRWQDYAKRVLDVRAPDVGLDAQQRAAYARFADKRDLAIVTAIAGGRIAAHERITAALNSAFFKARSQGEPGYETALRRRS